MSGVWKPKSKKKTAKWRAWWYDERGRTRSKAVSTDKAISLQYAAQREAECVQERLGLAPSGEQERKRLAAKPIGAHVEAYTLTLEQGQRTKTHVKHISGVITRFFAAANIRTLADLLSPGASDTLTATLAAIRDTQSARTANHALGALKAFLRWAVATGRIERFPTSVARLSPYRASRVYQRRTLTREEVAKLLDSIDPLDEFPLWEEHRERREIVISGRERELVYEFALGTGFRANEIRCVTVGDVDLESRTVTLSGEHTKNRKPVVQPISHELAKKLGELVEGRPAHELLFRIPEKTAKMLRFDLENAGIPYEVDGKVVDFHSLRGTYISLLVESGVNIKVVQKLARHSTITLTMDTYAQVDESVSRDALERLDRKGKT